MVSLSDWQVTNTAASTGPGLTVGYRACGRAAGLLKVAGAIPPGGSSTARVPSPSSASAATASPASASRYHPYPGAAVTTGTGQA
jgi:hypothetical protein